MGDFSFADGTDTDRSDGYGSDGSVKLPFLPDRLPAGGFFVLTGLSILLAVVEGVRTGWRPVRLWLAYGVALVSFVFWFWKAPELRLGPAFIWLAALLPLVPLLGRLTARPARWMATLALGLSLLFLGAKLYREEWYSFAKFWVLPDWFGYRELQADGIRYRTYRTQSGLVIIKPQGQVGPTWPKEQRCYEINQPCSPYFFDDLELRGTTLADGFRRHPHRQAFLPQSPANQ